MITNFPFRMAEADSLAKGIVNRSLIRLIVKFDQISNAADDNCPRWVRDGTTYIQIATFESAPSYRQLEAAIEDSLKVFLPDGPGCRYTYLSYELVKGDELCTFEQEQVDFARSFPDYYRDQDIVYGVSGSSELAGDYPANWSPPAYAAALLAARDEGLAALAQLAA